MKMDRYSNIMEWLERCKTIPGYEENMEGAEMMGARFKKALEESKTVTKDEVKDAKVSKNVV